MRRRGIAPLRLYGYAVWLCAIASSSRRSARRCCSPRARCHEATLRYKSNGTAAGRSFADGRSFSLRARNGRECSADIPELAAIAGALAKRRLIKNGQPIIFHSVARTDRGSIHFLYGNPELRRRAEHLRGQQQDESAPAPTDASGADSNVIRALTVQLADLRCRHHDEINERRTALAAAHCENLELRRELGTRKS